MPGGGLMQLVAYGAQDIYLTALVSGDTPQTFWFDRNTDLAIPLVSSPLVDNILYLTDEIIYIDEYEECIISLDQIHHNENIAKCSQCKKIAKYQLMQQWFNENKSCPHCRGTYPEVSFLCGAGQIQNLGNSERKHANENEEENILSKKAKFN